MSDQEISANFVKTLILHTYMHTGENRSFFITTLRYLEWFFLTFIIILRTLKVDITVRTLKLRLGRWCDTD